MEKTILITYTKREILKLIQDDYNKQSGTNHLLKLKYDNEYYHEIKPEVTLVIEMWDKSVTH